MWLRHQTVSTAFPPFLDNLCSVDGGSSEEPDEMNMATLAARPSSMRGPISYAVPERWALWLGVGTLMAL